MVTAGRTALEVGCRGRIVVLEKLFVSVCRLYKDQGWRRPSGFCVDSLVVFP